MNRAKLYLWIILVSFVMSGSVEGAFGVAGQTMNEFALAHMFVLMVLGFSWCNAHADSRGIKAPRAAAFWVALLPIVGVPLYFFRSMQWRHAAWSSVQALGFWLVCLAAYAAGSYVGTVLDWLIGRL